MELTWDTGEVSCGNACTGDLRNGGTGIGRKVATAAAKDMRHDPRTAFPTIHKLLYSYKGLLRPTPQWSLMAMCVG